MWRGLASHLVDMEVQDNPDDARRGGQADDVALGHVASPIGDALKKCQPLALGLARSRLAPREGAGHQL